MDPTIYCEPVSKSLSAFESQAQADEKAQHAFKNVSILKRSSSQLSDTRWGLQTSSRFYLRIPIFTIRQPEYF